MFIACSFTILSLALGALDDGAASRPAPPKAPALARPRVLFTVTPLSADRVLVAGGLADEHHPDLPLDDAEIIELDRDRAPRVVGSVRFSGRFLGGRFFQADAPLPGGRAVLFGGDLGGTVELFEPAASAPGGAFRAIGPLPGGTRICLTATTLEDGRVFVAGGLGIDKRGSRATALFDPKTDTIAAGPDLVEGRGAHAAVRLADGRVFLAGGVKRDSTELYDPVKNVCVAGPRMSTVRDDLAATLLADGTVLLTGGQDKTGKTQSSCERFDPATNAITPVGPLADERADHVALRLADGSVLVMGGEQDDGHDHDTVLASVERFDPATSTFRRSNPLQVPRDDFGAILLADGCVLVIGGQTSGDVVLSSIEIDRFDP